MKILLTGASGFIGTTLREHLTQDSMGFEVIGVDRLPPRERFQKFPNAQVKDHVVCCDLLDSEALTQLVRWHQPDAVVHVAAQARVEPSIVDPLTTYDLNVQATLNVMRACKEAGVKHLIAASSEATYGAAREYPCKENNDFNPGNPYAASKVAMDVLVQQFNRVVPTCVVRSGMGFGPRSNPKEQVVAKFIVKALQDQPLKFPAGDSVIHPTRDLNHVKDFSEGVRQILLRRATGVYNLSGGREYSVLDIAQRIVDAVGSGRIQYTTDFSYREGEAGFRTWLDCSKAERELGHKPKRHLEGEALASTIKWYEHQLNQPEGPFWAPTPVSA